MDAVATSIVPARASTRSRGRCEKADDDGDKRGRVGTGRGERHLARDLSAAEACELRLRPAVGDAELILEHDIQRLHRYALLDEDGAFRDALPPPFLASQSTSASVSCPKMK